MSNTMNRISGAPFRAAVGPGGLAPLFRRSLNMHGGCREENHDDHGRKAPPDQFIEGRVPATCHPKRHYPDADSQHRGSRSVQRLVHDQKREHRERREDQHRRRTKPARQHRPQPDQQNPRDGEQKHVGERRHPGGLLADEDQAVKEVLPHSEQRDFAEAGEEPEPQREPKRCKRTLVHPGRIHRRRSARHGQPYGVQTVRVKAGEASARFAYDAGRSPTRLLSHALHDAPNLAS